MRRKPLTNLHLVAADGGAAADRVWHPEDMTFPADPPAGDGATPQHQPFEYPPLPDYGETPPAAGYPPPPPLPPQYGAPGSYPPPPGQYPAPPVGYFDPLAPYGRDPLTGEPLSDKSKVIAGLLQLIGIFGLLGFGRIYIGQTALGIAQLVGGIVISAVTCGFGVVVPIVWGIVDAVLILTGRVRDQQGRPLRDGT